MSDILPWRPRPAMNTRRKRIAAALNEALDAVDERGNSQLQAMANRLVAQAVDGDVESFRAIADRTEGRVPQSSETFEDEAEPDLNDDKALAQALLVLLDELRVRQQVSGG
jgi:hypothetical protein